MPGPHLQCQKATEAVGHRPQPKGSFTWLTPPTPLTPGIDADTEASVRHPHGTPEHLDPARGAGVGRRRHVPHPAVLERYDDSGAMASPRQVAVEADRGKPMPAG